MAKAPTAAVVAEHREGQILVNPEKSIVLRTQAAVPLCVPLTIATVSGDAPQSPTDYAGGSDHSPFRFYRHTQDLVGLRALY